MSDDLANLFLALAALFQAISLAFIFKTLGLLRSLGSSDDPRSIVRRIAEKVYEGDDAGGVFSPHEQAEREEARWRT